MLAAPRIPIGPKKVRRRHWILAALMALLFHALVMLPRIPGWFVGINPRSPSPRVDIKQVDPRKLEAIRRQWSAREKQLLLDRNRSQPTAKEADPDARYMSDRNIRVEKEQRAKRSVTVPKPGAPGPSGQSMPPEVAQAPRPRAQRKLPSLGNLGVPLPNAPQKRKPLLAEGTDTPKTAPRQSAGQDGGEQFIADSDLPQGSENLLNAQESIYYSFYARLYDAIGPVWQSKIRQASRHRQLQPGDYSTQLDVVLDREGNLVAVNQVTPSGVTEFDIAADAAWKSLGRFPNPPAGLLDARGEVHTGWTFTVQVNQSFGLQSLPPERSY